MRTTIYLLIFLGIISAALFAESFRKTASDMYMESYAAQMRRQTGQSIAEIRTEEYRGLYEICDEHHNCTNATAGTENRAEKTNRNIESAKTFMPTPVWQ